jgi:homoserine O-succinyltransferase
MPSAPAESPLRLGIINVMPRAETYEPLLRRMFEASPAPELIFLRLRSHSYSSSDPSHLARYYSMAESALAGELDALVLTGAPVEALAFEEVRYWRELESLLRGARAAKIPTLGICWGGLALAALEGIPKVQLTQKLFGVFEGRWLVEAHPLRGAPGMACPQSRHASVDEHALEARARAGDLRLLVHGDGTGHTLFETTDGLATMHLGHPEYEVERLLQEWQRDRERRRTDVGAPVGVDLEHPQTTWRDASHDFMGRWLARAGAARTRRT